MWKFINQYVKKYWLIYSCGFIALTATNLAAVRIPLEIKAIIDGLKTNDQSDLKRFFLVIVGLAAIIFISRTLSRLFFFIPGRNVEFDIRNDLYKHLIRLSPRFYKENKVGDLMSRLVNDLSGIRVFVALAALHIFNTTISYIFVFSEMIKISLPLTLYVIAPIPLAMFGIRFLVKKLFIYMVRYQKLLGEVTDKIVEALSNIHLIKSYGIEDSTLSMFKEKNEEFLENGINLAKYRSSMFPFIGIIGSLGQCILFFVGGLWIIKDQLTIGDFTAMSLFLAQIVWPTASLAWIINIIQRGRTSLKRVNKILDEPEYYRPEDKQNIDIDNNAMSVKNLTFSFPDSKTPALNDVSFDIPKHSSIGFFGPTGCGKTTLAKILAGLETPPKNSVFLNYQDITSIPIATYWGLISYVPQLSFLFSDTITENIGYANQKFESPNKDIIEKLSKASSVYNDVMAFPDDFETIIGEKGIILSGGQKKRISLARALYKKHSILILDDHLSAVDHKTEHFINKAIYELELKTKIVVSHRISALVDCDNILVLENGKIVNQGSHKELIKKEGLYKDTWLYQQVEEQN
mgnify:CR=1 FL=1